MPVRLSGGFASLSTSAGDAVDSATINSRGTAGSCNAFSAAAGSSYQKWVSPAYSVGDVDGPLAVQES
jgi:hypothetical protein